MNDRTLPPDLEREAVLARVLRAKDVWTRTAVRFLQGHVSTEEVQAALHELDNARSRLRAIDEATTED